MSFIVTLDRDEMYEAAVVGVQRRLNGTLNGKRDTFNARPEDRWDRDIEGAIGEKAFSKWSGWPWVGKYGKGHADVGRAGVRVTRWPNGCLLLHPPPDDHPNVPYVLLTGLAPTYTVRGWIWGWGGMKPEYWRDPVGDRPAWFVPQSDLRLFPDPQQMTLDLKTRVA